MRLYLNTHPPHPTPPPGHPHRLFMQERQLHATAAISDACKRPINNTGESKTSNINYNYQTLSKYCFGFPRRPWGECACVRASCVRTSCVSACVRLPICVCEYANGTVFMYNSHRVGSELDSNSLAKGKRRPIKNV